MLAAHAAADPNPVVHDKDHPFHARVLENRLLSGPGSDKETRHIVLDLAGSGLTYEPGDSIGVYPTNRPRDVADLLGLLGSDGSEMVHLPRAEAPLTLREALEERLSLVGPTRKALEALAGCPGDEATRARLQELLRPEAKEALEAYLHPRDFIDLLGDFPAARPAPQALVDVMRRLNPRLYSIASSPRVTGSRVHLTVAIVRFHALGRQRDGVCTGFLADRVTPGKPEVPVFVSHSHFRLPEDHARDVIMVGPGTGIAPFRAFLQEREATRATGRNWLFFGDRRRSCDYLYEDDLEAWRSRGLLHRLDLAFSRDQQEKIYVQDRMREHGAELWEWLEGGAAFYVCGDAKRMARDVDAALHEIVATHGRLDAAGAADYVKRLKRERRYQRDVY